MMKGYLGAPMLSSRFLARQIGVDGAEFTAGTQTNQL
jgi:hypothetical protein